MIDACNWGFDACMDREVGDFDTLRCLEQLIDGHIKASFHYYIPDPIA